ncbi:MAG: GrpB family protein, partial [Ktedonobacteraceae bacterium]|nr:GrpB family protein [Ktedonobacteraceae bacterium]
MSSIVIAEYDPAWSQLYAEEQQKIRALIGTYIFDIQHIGSTSVPGLAAKPVIDIMIGIHSLDLVEQTVEPLASLGYEHLGEHGIPERHFFRKPAHAISFAERTHHLHMMERGHIQWETHQLFR